MVAEQERNFAIEISRSAQNRITLIAELKVCGALFVYIVS